MAVKRDIRYPGRWAPADADFPLGGPKNRTTSTSKDGSYFDRDFMADHEAFFQRLMTEAGITANKTPDTAPTSQFFEAMKSVIISSTGLTARDFIKSSTWEPAFNISGGVLRTACNVTVIIDSAVLTFAANETISTPTLLVGVDYAIYATEDGLIVSNNFTVPDGYTAANSRRIGGFHYGDNEYKDYSFYDLHFRPRARDPRGMVIDMGERFWADIYLTNTTPNLLGTSAYNAQIADGSSLPKVPTQLGGDGVQQYANYSQFAANELLACYGKRLPNYQEFQMLARGSESGYVRGSDPVKTLFDSSARSIIGCEQVSGNVWQWGSEVWDRGNGTSGYSWHNIAEGYGQMYAAHSQAVGASLFGGDWGVSGLAGSRASHWGHEPSHSISVISSRGVCEHFQQN